MGERIIDKAARNKWNYKNIIGKTSEAKKEKSPQPTKNQKYPTYISQPSIN
jgi:hypothetical protein